MDLEIFTLCDFAQDANGKLTIVGTFDQVSTPEAKPVINSCYLAIRLRVEAHEKGQHQLSLSLKDPAGNNVLQNIEGNFEVNHPEGFNTIGVNLIINLNQLKFERTGVHKFTLSVNNNKLGSFPLTVRQVNAPKQVPFNTSMA